MAKQQIVSRESIQTLVKELKKTFATGADVEKVQTGLADAIKGAKLVGNSIKLYTDKAMESPEAFSLDLPEEMVLDQAKTKFEGSFTWSQEAYPGSEDPSLDGKPVMVLAVKGDGEDPNYSFLNMEKLVDTYTSGDGDGSTSVTVSGYKISVNVKISEESDNQLQLKDDGLFVPKPASVDIGGKVDKVVPSAAGNLAGLDASGGLTDSGISGESVLTTADVQDFTQQEIESLLSAAE